MVTDKPNDVTWYQPCNDTLTCHKVCEEANDKYDEADPPNIRLVVLEADVANQHHCVDAAGC